VATVNFSVPSDLKEAFDKVFRRQNKSAVLSDLMQNDVACRWLLNQQPPMHRPIWPKWG
jgi:hypothetical protein